MKSAQTKRKNCYVLLDVVYWQLTVMMVITTMVSSFVAEWNDHTMQMRGGAKSRNLLYSVLNFELRNCSLDPQHPIADSDVRLYVLLPVFPIFQLFAQSRPKYP